MWTGENGARYRYPAQDAVRFHKHGVELTLYGQDSGSATVVRVSVESGHFQEFYDLKSTYTYYVVSGRGTFYLNDEPVVAEASDVVVAPPGTRIHYFGTMEIVLTVSPEFDEANERHVRFIARDESPYA
ncbi:cupin domain-containing protein [Lentzea sp. JNUCC 0626]|uniref:cupin domain-containing protein n=1 Tax=Lentzea sp. JNUCC 0626 TaxID=3367513 RepID=UPI0037489045